jgi:predicted transcriptional regulator
MKQTSMKWNRKTIKELIEIRKLKKKDMAESIGVSAQLMSYYLSDPPTVHKAGRLASSMKKAGMTAVDWKELIA